MSRVCAISIIALFASSAASAQDALDASYVFTTGDVDGLDYGSFGWGFRYRF